MNAQAIAQMGGRAQRTLPFAARWEFPLSRIVRLRSAPGGAKRQSKRGHMNSEAEVKAKATGSHDANEHKRTSAQLAYFSGRAR